MTAIDRSMPSPLAQRFIHGLAAQMQQKMTEAGVHLDYIYELPDGFHAKVVALHRYTAECSYTGFDGDELTFLVPLPKENLP